MAIEWNCGWAGEDRNSERGPQVAEKLNALGRTSTGFPSKIAGFSLHWPLTSINFNTIRRPAAFGRDWPNRNPTVSIGGSVVDVALQTANTDEIEHNIRKIKEIQGIDGSTSRRCEINYLIWQAHAAWTRILRKLGDFSRMRGELNDLDTRRPNWPLVSLTMAKIEQEELRQPGLKEDEIRAKEDDIIRLYMKAIDLGEHGVRTPLHSATFVEEKEGCRGDRPH